MIEVRTQGPWAPQTVASDVLTSGFWVSTVDLGSASPMLRSMDSLISTLSMLVDNDRPADLSAPGSYETMVFKWDAEKEEVAEWEERDFSRYASREAALAGHEALVAKWLEKS